MNDWQSTCLGRRSLPRDLSDFEIEAFFTFSEAERRIIEERRRPVLKLALALQIGFLRMSGRLLEAVRIVPPSLWRHLGEQFDVAAPDLASLRSMYHRRRTLFEHQEVACETLGFHWLSNAQRGALVRVVRDELTRTFDRQRLLQFARRWLYDHRLVVLRERELRALILQALRQYEGQFAAQIVSSVEPQQLSAWKAAIVQPHASGSTMQSWLWAAPAKHSTPQIKGVLDRIEVLKCLGVSAQLTSVPDAVLSRYAQRLVSRAPAVAARIAEPARTIEVACFLRYTLLRTTDPKLTKLRAALDKRVGEAQLPELILAVDAQVRFSWIMLGREPRSSRELLMVYAGILAHGTALSAAETARMMPQLTAVSVRQAMKWARDERRLAEACRAVLTFMHRHPISTTWGRSDLASSDMMSLETHRRVFVARNDPRRQTPSIGIYGHTRDRWGISYAQSIVLNERQAGAAIEGVVRDERLETAQLAVDTHGYTDVAMALAKGLGFDLCPRLKALKDRHLFLPRGSAVPATLSTLCHPNLDLSKAAMQWDRIVHLVASVHSGHTSAVNVLARYGSASRGDPLYEALVQLGRLLRTIFLADYFVNEAFRREILRVLNRGESVNALKRSIYVGRVAGYQAKQPEEMQAVADALSLLANIVMAWNTMKMQTVLDRWNTRRSTAVPPELIGRIAPTRTEGLNLRGVFSFPIDDYSPQLLPSLAAAKSRAVGT